jgi:hypothetical protein
MHIVNDTTNHFARATRAAVRNKIENKQPEFCEPEASQWRLGLIRTLVVSFGSKSFLRG